ncbi:hypothetical protein PRNP1_005113 [Phytophthora ramorum]
MRVIFAATLTIALLSAGTGNGNAKSRIEVDDRHTIDLNPSVQHIPIDETLRHLRPPSPRVPQTFDMSMGSTVFRDSYRCGYLLFTGLAVFTPWRVCIWTADLHAGEGKRKQRGSQFLCALVLNGTRGSNTSWCAIP